MVKEVHAAHILVKSEKKAREILDKINAGESFADLAKRKSECPSGEERGRSRLVRQGKDGPGIRESGL